MKNIYANLPKSKVDYLKYLLKEKGLSTLMGKVASSARFRSIQFVNFIFPNQRQSSFSFQGRRLRYTHHLYNNTTYNERALEISLAKHLTKNAKHLLEIGAVLYHYMPTPWDVVDKFEIASGVINQDIVDFYPKKKYDTVISISTFEHIGYDDNPINVKKSLNAIRHVKKNCLKPGGVFYLTIPIGYNPKFDRLLFKNDINFDQYIFFKRDSIWNHWSQTTLEEAKKAQYDKPYNNANCVALCIYKNPR